MLVGLIIGVITHEFMHGYAAYRMGDTTAKRAGRLTLDPLAHIDPFGTLILPGILFALNLIGGGIFPILGYAKPVPINPFLFRKPRGIVWVSLSGPLTNLFIGVVFVLIGKLLTLMDGGATLRRIIYTCAFIAYINAFLFIFNLIPIPPLDGSRVVGYFLRGNAKRIYSSIEPFGFAIILIFIMGFGFLFDRPLASLANSIFSLLELPLRYVVR